MDHFKNFKFNPELAKLRIRNVYQTVKDVMKICISVSFFILFSFGVTELLIAIPDTIMVILILVMLFIEFFGVLFLLFFNPPSEVEKLQLSSEKVE